MSPEKFRHKLETNGEKNKKEVEGVEGAGADGNTKSEVECLGTGGGRSQRSSTSQLVAG